MVLQNLPAFVDDPLSLEKKGYVHLNLTIAGIFQALPSIIVWFDRLKRHVILHQANTKAL